MNIAYIDSQNMHLSTERDTNPWRVDMRKLREYLEARYGAREVYLFLGAKEKCYGRMYHRFRDFGYRLVFREHNEDSTSAKKGNVDVDIVFQVMRDVKDRDDLAKVVLVSGDGDYKRMVDYLIESGKFAKMVLPSKRNASRLYKDIPPQMKAYLSTKGTREMLELKAKEDACGNSRSAPNLSDLDGSA